MDITEAMPADMLVAAMGDRTNKARVIFQALHIGGEHYCCGYW